MGPESLGNTRQVAPGPPAGTPAHGRVGLSPFVASDSFSQGGSHDSATLRLLTPGVAPAPTFTSRFRFTALRTLPTLRRPRYRRGPPPPSRGVGGGTDGLRSTDLSKGRAFYFWARMAEGVDDSSKDFIKSTDEGSILEVATFCD